MLIVNFDVMGSKTLGLLDGICLLGACPRGSVTERVNAPEGWLFVILVVEY